MQATATTQIELEAPTRTLYLYGKNGKAAGPTKAYPTPVIAHLTPTLVKDFGYYQNKVGVAVWKYPAFEDKAPEAFLVSFYNEEGMHRGGGEHPTLEAAISFAEKYFIRREYGDKKKELFKAYLAQVGLLDEEYKDRI